MPRLLSNLRRFALAHWAVLLPACAYLYLFPYQPEVRSPNELCRLHQTRALVDHHTLEINQVLQSEGYVGDLSCVAIARDPQGHETSRRPCPNVKGDPRYREEHYYPSKAPLISFAATPVYAALELVEPHVDEVTLVFFARLFVLTLPSILLLILLRRWLRACLDPSAAESIVDPIVAVFGLGTLAFSYTQLFMSHQTTAVLLFACFYALHRLRLGAWRARGYLVAGLFAGLAVAAEYTAVLGVLPLAGYALLTARGGARGRIRGVLLGTLGALPIIVALAAYHWAAFGHPIDSGYKYLNDLAYQGWHHGGFLGIHLPDARAFLLSFFSPLRGLFTLSPFLLLAFGGFRLRDKALGPELLLCLVTFALYAYFTSSFAYDSWGWTTGPRHLTPLVPFLLLPIALFLSRTRHPALLLPVAAGLALFSVWATGALTLLNYIPDSFSDALARGAFPLMARGFFPHNLLSLVGLPNPWGILPGLALILGTGLTAAHFLVPATRRLRSAAIMTGVCAALFAFHFAFPRDADAVKSDLGTLDFLQKLYSPRPGEPPPTLFRSEGPKR